MTVRPTFFATPASMRRWFERHHASAGELLVGFYKRASGKPSVTWPESVDVALCFGWIDGVRRSIDATAYTIRFTPRRATSIWSAINVRRMSELRALGLVAPAGLAAFEKRSERKSGIYSYEQRVNVVLSPDFEAAFRKRARAWTFFQAQAPWYRRTATHWVMTAKRPETREKRLAALIDASARGEPIAPLRRTRGASGAQARTSRPRAQAPSRR